MVDIDVSGGQHHGGIDDDFSMPQMSLKLTAFHVMDAENDRESLNAYYLLETLRNCGTDLGSRINGSIENQLDADICAFLASIDNNFDAKAELHVLEAKEGEEKLLTKTTEIAKRHAVEVKGEAAVNK